MTATRLLVHLRRPQADKLADMEEQYMLLDKKLRQADDLRFLRIIHGQDEPGV